MQRVLVSSQIELEMGSRYTLRYVVRLACPVYGPRCVCLISYVLDSYWSSSRHLLCVYFFAVRPDCALLYLGASYSRRTMCTGKFCYPLHSTWVSRVGVPLTSRHLLCVYVSRVLRLCRLVPERVVLCVAVCCATHCMVHGIGGYVCHLLQGTCSVCSVLLLCIDVSYCVHRYTMLLIA